MKINIYENLDTVSTNYHSGGGAVIVSDDPQNAWAEHYKEEAKDSKWESADLLEISEMALPNPDKVYECDSAEESVTIFEDAGCC